ncbi:MAG: hypothetical protein V3V49_06735 [Candidatus Krumholzibacteria bacterium]
MTEKAVHTIEVPTGDDFPVYGDLYMPASGSPLGIVVLTHGFKGYRTWGFFPYLARSLRDAGMAAFAMDFSHNGRSAGGGPAEREAQEPSAGTAEGHTAGSSDPTAASPYPHPGLFSRNTIRREIDDLAAVIRYIEDGGLGDYFASPPPIGLHGHSRGGVVAILNTLEHPEVNAVCTWATPDDPDTFTTAQKEKWRRKGVYDFVLAEDGIPLSVSVAYLDDLEGNHAAYHVAERARALRVPLLVVHGEADMVVPVAGARRLHAAPESLDDKRLLILRTGHSFGLAYPYSPASTTSQALTDAVAETVDWFKTHFASGGR